MFKVFLLLISFKNMKFLGSTVNAGETEKEDSIRKGSQI